MFIIEDQHSISLNTVNHTYTNDEANADDEWPLAQMTSTTCMSETKKLNKNTEYHKNVHR